MPSRREALRLAGSGLTIVIAGCLTHAGGDSSPTENHAALSSATSSPSPTNSPTPTALPAISVDDIGFDVSVVEQFTNEHPARIDMALANRAGTAITLDDGVSPPFASYWNQPREDDEWLLIVPDMSESMYDTAALSGLDSIPSTPTGDACWHVTENVTNLLRQRFTVLDADQTISQRFDVYDFQGNTQNDECLAVGEYAFEYSPAMGRGEETPSGGSGEFQEITLGCTVTVHDDKSLSVSVAEPAIG